jgi:hypothetical protein
VSTRSNFWSAGQIETICLMESEIRLIDQSKKDVGQGLIQKKKGKPRFCIVVLVVVCSVKLECCFNCLLQKYAVKPVNPKAIGKNFGLWHTLN